MYTYLNQCLEASTEAPSLTSDQLGEYCSGPHLIKPKPSHHTPSPAYNCTLTINHFQQQCNYNTLLCYYSITDKPSNLYRCKHSFRPYIQFISVGLAQARPNNKTYLVVGLAVYIAAGNKQPKLADRQLLRIEANI